MNIRDYGADCDIRRASRDAKKEYYLWVSLFKKKYGDRFLKKNPSYIGTDFCETWKVFSAFYEDLKSIYGYENFSNSDWQLDKDILVKGNKTYSHITCCFVPQEINKLLTSRKRFRGSSPIGVTWVKRDKVFLSQVSIDGKQHKLGYFKSETEAFNAYKKAKEQHIKEIANKWKDQIDPRVYEALISWNVEITD